MKISFYTLGCRVNQYETEMLKERFSKAGHEVVAEGDFADAYIINTCTVTSLADRKSRQHIRRMKKLNPDSIVAVTGCYAQTNPNEVAGVEGVDIIIGTNKKSELVDLVREYYLNSTNDENRIIRITPYDELTEYEETGIITSMESRTRAYIKVQEGCDRFCSYCVIPYARGHVRSRRPEDILLEAKSLLSQGFKELILTGINTALYGTEAGFEYGNKKIKGIELIIAMLNDLPGDFRIRLGSLEPTVINKDDVMSLLKYEKLCHHFHLSVQSGSDSVLSAMNRHYTRAEYLEIVEALRKVDAGFGISTDIIVGFPGESDADFSESVSIIKKAMFCKVHAFKYSKRAGTRAAELKNHISPEIKNKRSRALIEAGETSQTIFFKSCEGTCRKVLIEEFDEVRRLYTGYTDSYIKVYIAEEGIDLKKNGFVMAKLGVPFDEGVRATVCDL